MKISLDALLVLDAIDRKGSYAAAANELNRVPSALTYTVQKLEQDLGVSIFDREGYRAKLTPAGKELLQQGRHLLRAIQQLESRVQKIATGWEAELRIAVDTILELERFFPLFEEFYQKESTTRLRISTESLGGAWDAIVSDRADLVIGAVGEGPPGGGYLTQPLMPIKMLFAVAPSHPLAQADEPISEEVIKQYRAVAAADSSRILAPKTTGLFEGQDVLTVPDMLTKIHAQIYGLGCGFLPAHSIQSHLKDHALVEKRVEGGPEMGDLSVVWKSGYQGKALHWFVDRLRDFSIE